METRKLTPGFNLTHQQLLLIGIAVALVVAGATFFLLAGRATPEREPPTPTVGADSTPGMKGQIGK